MLSTNQYLSSSLMHRVARNPAAGARGPAGGVKGQRHHAIIVIVLVVLVVYTPPAGPRAPAAGLRATRCIRLLDKDRLVDNIGLLNKSPEEYLFNPGVRTASDY